MNAEIIFVHYEKVTIIRLSLPQKILYGKKCVDRYGKPVLFCNDGCCVWKTSLAGMHSLRSCLQLFSRSNLPQGKRKKLKGRMKVSLFLSYSVAINPLFCLGSAI